MKEHSKSFWVLSFVVVALLAAASQAQVSFSIDILSPSVRSAQITFPNPTVFPDDIFDEMSMVGFAPPPPLLQINGIGLGGMGGSFVEVNAYSQGRPLSQFSTSAPAVFSVDRGSAGVGGTASSNEFNIPGSEQSSDLFFSIFNSNNTLFRDGDGVASGANPAAPPLALAEPTTVGGPIVPIPPSSVGDLDGLDLRMSAGVSPSTRIYFSVDQGTVTVGTYGGTISAADIFVNQLTSGYNQPLGGVAGNPPAAPVYAPESALGFGQFIGNDLDALVVFDDGDGQYLPGTDIIVFSLAPGSGFLGQTDSLLGLTVSPGDILVDGSTAVALGAANPTVGILHTAESLGLRTMRTGQFQSDDNLNALDIPEPATLALLLLGGLALLRRRRVG